MPVNPWDEIEQPPDDAIAGGPWFYAETYREYQKGLEVILNELETHRNTIESLGLEASPFEKEVSRIRQMVEWGKERLDSVGTSPAATIHIPGVSYGSLRYLKAGILYRAYLVEQQKRDFAREPKLAPRSVLQSFDTRINQLRNLAESGMLNGLRPAEVFFELLPSSVAETGVPSVLGVKVALLAATASSEIPVIDPVLRKRCLTLLDAIEGSGGTEQLDTVIREMSVILEDRVRELSGFTGKAAGADLFSATMTKDPPLIRFSPEKDIQEAAHLFFRGYSGLVRNEAMHRLVPSYTKERVLQLLGIVDYLLFLLSKAETTKSGGES